MSRPQDLYKLQLIDTQLDEANNRLKQIAEELSDERPVMSAKKKYDEAESLWNEKRANLSQADEAVKSQKIKIEQTESTLYGGSVRNPKELQDLQQEAAALKRFLTTLEDRLLEAMILLEEKEADLQEANKELKQAKENHEVNTQTLQVEKKQLGDEVARLESYRKGMISELANEDLREYEKIRRKRAGVAVVKVVNKSCGACGTTLTAALYQASRSPSKITTCTTCGRILYAGT